MAGKRREVVYIAVAFGVSWTIWAPLVFGAALPPWYYYLAAAGPAAGALAATAAERGSRELPPWIARKFRPGRPGPGTAAIWAATALAFIAAVGIERAATGEWKGVIGLGRTGELPGWTPPEVAALFLLSFGACEELGWRGYLYPKWRERWGNGTAALAAGGVWAAWHLPAFFCNPTYSEMGWTALGWGLSILAGSVLLSWMADAVGGSILPLALWHGAFDFATASDSAGAFIAPILSAAVLIAGPFLWISLARRAGASNRTGAGFGRRPSDRARRYGSPRSSD